MWISRKDWDGKNPKNGQNVLWTNQSKFQICWQEETVGEKPDWMNGDL